MAAMLSARLFRLWLGKTNPMLLLPDLGAAISCVSSVSRKVSREVSRVLGVVGVVACVSVVVELPPNS